MESENPLSNTTNSRKNRKHSNFNTESDPILFLHLFHRNLVSFAVIIIACLVIVSVYLRYTVPIYESELIFQVGSLNTANQVLDVSNFHESNNDLAKDIEVLRSKLLFKRSLSRIPIDVTYYNEGKILAYELYKATPIKVDYVVKDFSIVGVPFYVKFIDKKTFQLSEGGKLLGEFKTNTLIQHPKVELNLKVFNDKLKKGGFLDAENSGLYFVINNIDDLTNNYIQRLAIFPLNSSAKTIKIAFQDNNPLKTKDIVTAVAKEYINYDIEERSKSSKKILEFIDNQLDKYYNKLKISENKIENFQKSNSYRGNQLPSSYFEESSKLENKLVDLDLKINVLMEVKKSISKELKNIDVYDLLPILSGTEYGGNISSDINDLRKLLVQKENLHYDLTDNSEVFKSLDHRIQIKKKVLFESITVLIDQMVLQREGVLGKLEEMEKKSLNVPAQELQYARLQRVLSTDEKFFTLLMDKRTEYSISEAGFVPQHKVLDRALVPVSPVYPKIATFYILALAAGLVISLLLLFFKYFLKNTISSIDEIIRQSYSSVGVLGIIPNYKHDIPVSQLVIDKNPKSVVAESFRAVRVQFGIYRKK